MKTLAQTFKALSDETRLRILAQLFGGERCVCDLMAALDLPQSTVSRHLAYLRNASLVEDRREGVWMYYRLREDLPAFEQELLCGLARELSSSPQADQDSARISEQSRRPC